MIAAARTRMTGVASRTMSPAPISRGAKTVRPSTMPTMPAAKSAAAIIDPIRNSRASTSSIAVTPDFPRSPLCVTTT